jgi:hypothetical protein
MDLPIQNGIDPKVGKLGSWGGKKFKALTIACFILDPVAGKGYCST